MVDEKAVKTKIQKKTKNFTKRTNLKRKNDRKLHTFVSELGFSESCIKITTKT